MKIPYWFYRWLHRPALPRRFYRRNSRQDVVVGVDQQGRPIRLTQWQLSWWRMLEDNPHFLISGSSEASKWYRARLQRMHDKRNGAQ